MQMRARFGKVRVRPLSPQRILEAPTPASFGTVLITHVGIIADGADTERRSPGPVQRYVRRSAARARAIAIVSPPLTVCTLPFVSSSSRRSIVSSHAASTSPCSDSTTAPSRIQSSCSLSGGDVTGTKMCWPFFGPTAGSGLSASKRRRVSSADIVSSSAQSRSIPPIIPSTSLI
jgi:hypothetical protein